MIRNQDILKSLPLLASVLGRNYGVKVQIGGNSAYTDGNIIHIPSLPLNCGEDLVRLARGYIDHESSHIRFTEFEALEAAKLDPVTHHIWNSIEDWRVEERLSSIYPGCRGHFHWLARRIFVEEADKNQEEAGNNPASAILSYVLLSVRSWNMEEIKIPLQNTISFVDAHFQGLRLQIEAVLERIHESCQNTQDAISYACEIAEIIKKWKPSKTCQSSTQSHSRNNENGDLEDISASQSRENIDSSNSEQRTFKSTPDEDLPQRNPKQPDVDQETNSEINSKSQQNDPSQDIADLFSSKVEDLPKSLGKQIASTLQGGQSANQDASICVATVGSIGGHDTVSQDEKENALRASVALRSRLQGLLQANLRKSVGISRRGSLSEKHLYRLGLGNPKIFASQEELKGLNTAVHILVDVSSSMSGASIQLARQSCYAVVKALSDIKGINPAVTAFPSADGNENTVAPLIKHGERLPTYLNIKAYGSTPLAEALWWIMQTMLPLRERRKIILILSDGIPNSLPNAQYALDNAKKAGFEVFGIGIFSSCIAQLLPKTSQTIYNLNDLAPSMFTLLQKTLLEGEKV